MTYPDRSDVPRSAARPLRYMDRYVTVRQGEVFFITETLVALEGIERGPAGNISLAAAFSLAQEMNQDQIIVVQETEYTGAGKHHQAQLSFARKNGIDVRFGHPSEEVPGKNIILPSDISLIKTEELELDKLRVSLIKNLVKSETSLLKSDLEFLVEETNSSVEFVKNVLKANHIQWEE